MLVVGPLLIVFWLAGLRLLFTHPFARPVALTYVALFVVDALAGAKPYYLGGIYFALFAAGGVWFERRVSDGTGEHRVRRMGALMLVGAAVAVPLTLPVLPVSAQAKSGWEGNINKDLSATVGWKRVVRQLDAIARALPARERANLVVFTGDYGAAGAVDLYGARFGLPHAISGHNNYWWWGPRGAREGATVIAVNLDKSYLQTIFASVTRVGSVDTGYGIWTEERGERIFICRNQTRTWAEIWPGAKHYS